MSGRTIRQIPLPRGGQKSIRDGAVPGVAFARPGYECDAGEYSGSRPDKAKPPSGNQHRLMALCLSGLHVAVPVPDECDAGEYSGCRPDKAKPPSGNLHRLMALRLSGLHVAVSLPGACDAGEYSINLRDIFFFQTTEELRIRPLCLNVAEREHGGE